jgi:hypothetical protein
MLVGKRCPPTYFFVKFRISKIHNFLDVKGMFLKLWIFTNFNMVFPVLVLVFNFKEFSEWVLHGHSKYSIDAPVQGYIIFTNYFPPSNEISSKTRD